jgi:septum formation protein
MAERSPATPRPSLVLVSASPRRRWLLDNLGLTFEVSPADIDERPRPEEMPEAYARRMAREKAAAAGAANGGAWLLAADTVVALGATPLGKPRDAAEAASMLTRLSGRDHVVFTGVAIVAPDASTAVNEVVATQVRFRVLSAEDVARYIATGEPFDRAGAYAIQGEGAHLIDRIEGSYTNVIGLPVPEVMAWLRSCRAV